jgi:hypothetical protein
LSGLLTDTLMNGGLLTHNNDCQDYWLTLIIGGLLTVAIMIVRIIDW